MTFTLFYSANSITNTESTNHWIPFTEQEVNAQERFESHFMTDFINGKFSTALEPANDLFNNTCHPELGSGSNEMLKLVQHDKREFSEEAKAVFDAGRTLWTYYHEIASQARNDSYNVNASLYDIREYFQGRNDKGRMNSKSDDETYMELIGELRNKLNFLADKIKPKIYEYEFLKA